MLPASFVRTDSMESPELQRLRAAIVRDPGNAELRYLLGAELAQRREYPEAVAQMRTALDIDPKLHFARLQLGLLYLTMSQPDDSLAIWAPLEELDETAALKAFKRGLEALIRDDFSTCIGFLQRGIELNKQNAPLNDDMSQLIDRVRDGSVIAAPSHARGLHADFSRYGEPRTPGTEHYPGLRCRAQVLLSSCMSESSRRRLQPARPGPTRIRNSSRSSASAFSGPSWQVICHVSEIPNPGDYQCFDFIGEMLFAMRGNDGAVRAFHNVCRHRAARLLDGPRGTAPAASSVPTMPGPTISKAAWPRSAIAAPFRIWTSRANRWCRWKRRSTPASCSRASQGGGPTRRADDGAVSPRRSPRTSSKSSKPIGPRHAAAAQGQLEERRRQLLRRAAHPGGASRPHAIVRRDLSASNRASG